MLNSDVKPKRSETIRAMFICIALAAVVFTAFEGVRNNGFVNYDDDLYVTDNPVVQGGLNFESILWAFTTWHAGNWHPLTWISHLIDSSVFGKNPAGHHLVSVGFHIANVILLFLILKKMTNANWLSAFVAAVFGLHPLGVESVAWVAERKNILSSFFAFLTIAAYLRYAEKPNLRQYVAVTACFAAGLLAKPMLVTLPFLLILLDYWPIRRFENVKGVVWLWQAFAGKAPLILMSAASCVVTYLAQARSDAVMDIVTAPLWLRLSNAIMSYSGYIGKIFYPVSLAVLYPLDFNGRGFWLTAASFAGIFIITLVVIAVRRRHRFLLTGWFWYLGTLIPVIGLVQVGVQSMADRYTYLPGIGIYIITAWLAWGIVTKLDLPRIVPAAAGAMVLVVLLLITRAQVGYWKDSLTLCEHTLAVTKNNYIMQNNLGEALRTTGHPDEAIEHYKQAIEINPMHARSHNNFGCALRDKGILPEAAAEFEKATAIQPGYAKAHNNYGAVLAGQKRYGDAIREFGKALSINPYYLSAMNNMWQAGTQGDMPDAVLEVLLDLEHRVPGYAELYYRAGIIYETIGKPEEAKKQFEKAFELANSQGDTDLVQRTSRKLDTYWKKAGK
jgi:tetratricopeptide (TPR) repeat protein